MLDAGAFFQSELCLAVGTANIAVGLDIAHLHILALDKITHAAEDIHESAVLIQALVDILRQCAEDRQCQQQHDDNDHDRAARKQVDHIEDRRDDQYKIVELVVAVTVLHEFGRFSKEISHVYHLIQPISYHMEI